jgi:hypothetical protein
MATTRPQGGNPAFDPKSFSFTNRLQEIGVFFNIAREG